MTSAEKKESRRYLRHPSQLPLMCQIEGHIEASEAELRDFSFGGIRIVCASDYAPGDLISMNYPNMNVRDLHGEVVWSEQMGDGSGRYICGVRFTNLETFARARLFEQLCCIEVYRRDQKDTEGRAVAPNEAAREWIENTAKHFPK